MPDRSTFPAARKLTVDLYEAVKELHTAIAVDAKSNAIPAANQFDVIGGKEALKRAEHLLAKDHYKLCFAGGFSAGKSTTINALLGDPDLLPTAAGECTLSITIMTGPLNGRELVRVKYFPRDIAIKQVVFHQKRYRNAFKQFDTKARHAGPDEQVEIIREVIAWLGKAYNDESLPEALRKEYDKGKAAKYAGELSEFLHYMDKYASRCGTMIEDDLTKAATYLTYDEKQGGLGHLFMVDQVFIHRHNVLFEQEGIQIVDLPGIDSTNAYARQVTMGYLNEADLVVNVLPPQGFTMSYIDIINEMSEANRGNIANKMFYIINRFDANEERNFCKQELEALLRDQIAAEIDKNGLNSRNLFAACALLEIHRLRGHKDRYDAMTAGLQSRIKAMGDNVEQPWRRIAEDALSGRAIGVIRDTILKYLHEQLAFERLRDVQIALKQVIEQADLLLGRNQGLIAAARARHTTRIARIREFVEKTNQQLEAHLAGLASGLPDVIQRVIQASLKPAVAAAVARFNQIPLADVAAQTRFTGGPARLQNPASIKQHWIDFAKTRFCDDFVNTVQQTLVGNVQSFVDQQVKEARLDVVLAHISGTSGRDLAGPVVRAVEIAKQNIDIITRLRAQEETWPLRKQPIHPQGFEPAWSAAIEESFKKDIVSSFTSLFHASCDRLAAALGAYYQDIILRLVADVKARSDDLEAALKAVDGGDVPMELVTGEAQDPEEQKKRRLLLLAAMHEKAVGTSGQLTAMVKA